MPAVFEENKSKLFGIAYRMVGVVSDVEDILQEAYIRWHNTDKAKVENPQAFLVTIVTRLCIDHLNRVKEQRERYIGPWLPEPIYDESAPGPDWQRELSDTLSLAFVSMLEKLNPVERAVFILREAFEFQHQDVAEIIGKSADNSRQLDRRAREKLKYDKTRYQCEDEAHQKLLVEFMTACASGQLDTLADLLAEDIVAYSDGGGEVRAALRPLQGRPRVLRFLRRVMMNIIQGGNARMEFAKVNGQQGLKIFEGDRLATVLSFQFHQGKLQALYSVRNPYKLENT